MAGWLGDDDGLWLLVMKATTNPVYNIRDDKVERAVAHFSKLPSTHEALMQQQQAGAKP